MCWRHTIGPGLLAVAACGSSGHQAPADAFGQDAGLALGQLMPQVVNSTPPTSGAAVLSVPRAMAITYDNDPNRSDFETFLTQYAASTAWHAQAAEYGVGALTVRSPGHVAGNAPLTLSESDVLSLLTANTSGVTPAWGAPDRETIYEFSIPQGVTFDSGGQHCCTDFDGYHSTTIVESIEVPFAILCGCSVTRLHSDLGLTPLQILTETANHETVEAATDPYITGFVTTDDAHFAWSYEVGGEVGDMCTFVDTTNELQPTGIAYAIQRTWSNAAALAGHDPCVPDATSPYYQTVPETPDAISLPGVGTSVATSALKVPIGGDGIVTLHVYADDANAGPFTVQLDDYSATSGGPQLLAFTQPSGAFHAGDTVTVPVHVNGSDTGLGGTAEAFRVTTKPAVGPSTYFYALIGQ